MLLGGDLLLQGDSAITRVHAEDALLVHETRLAVLDFIQCAPHVGRLSHVIDCSGSYLEQSSDVFSEFIIVMLPRVALAVHA